AAHPGRDEAAGDRNLAFVAEVEPCTAEDQLDLPIEDGGIHVDRFVDPSILDEVFDVGETLVTAHGRPFCLDCCGDHPTAQLRRQGASPNAVGWAEAPGTAAWSAAAPCAEAHHGTRGRTVGFGAHGRDHAREAEHGA